MLNEKILDRIKLRCFYARILAKLIDFVLILGLSFMLYPLGLLIGIGYIVIADSLGNGQSIGKKMVGFGVLSLVDGSPCSLKQSFFRNLPFIMPLSLGLVPFGGPILTLILLFFVSLCEVVIMCNNAHFYRLGDMMAETTVIGDDQNREDIHKNKKCESWYKDQAPSTL